MNQDTATGPPVPVDYLLIGGGVATVSASERLRNEGEKGTIFILCTETCNPYDRPPLTGSILTGEIMPEQTLIRPPSAYEHDAIEVRLHSAVREVLPKRHLAVDQNKTVYCYRKLLVTTGAEPRRLDVQGKELAGILTLHTTADALALRTAEVRQDKITIVGSSFVAIETATTLVQPDLHVTIIDEAGSIFPKIVSPLLGRFFFDRCIRQGIEAHLNERIVRFVGDNKVSGVLTTAGKLIACDTVILAVGVTPQIGFLRNSGIATGDGLLVDEFLRTRPRWLKPPVPGEEFPTQWKSLYDAAALAQLLEKYVDFSRLASSPIRLIVGTVDVELGELVFVDSRSGRLTPAHILVSSSLPPAFRWTSIDGRHYWDSGFVSNSPLEHVLSVTGTDNKDVVIVDLSSGRRQLPKNLAGVVVRRGEITYGERINNDSRLRELPQDYQALITDIMLSVNSETAKRIRQRPRHSHLMGRGAATSELRIVREGHGKLPPALDYDFSSETHSRHRQERYRIAKYLFPGSCFLPAIRITNSGPTARTILDNRRSS
ncbi:MAG: FAD-dependent oxidoreductase [Acidiphilium sp.]|nr:FAD-dependent oxidoreductase [Acidiphilium sp.]